ncbi:hypothetical protein KVV02_001844, partial [Mortierella alpina]
MILPLQDPPLPLPPPPRPVCPRSPQEQPEQRKDSSGVYASCFKKKYLHPPLLVVIVPLLPPPQLQQQLLDPETPYSETSRRLDNHFCRCRIGSSTRTTGSLSSTSLQAWPYKVAPASKTQLMALSQVPTIPAIQHLENNDGTWELFHAEGIISYLTRGCYFLKTKKKKQPFIFLFVVWLLVLQEGFPDRPRLVHRLDRTTSGLLILARTRKAAQELTRRFHDGTTGAGTSGARDGDGDGEERRESGLQKMYIAIVGSTHPRPVAGRRCTNKDGNVDLSSTDRQSRLSGNMIIVKEGKQERIEIQKGDVDFTDGLARSSGPVWPSVTYFCIASQSVHNGMYYGVLRLYPRTGRKHQLRVHCAQLLKAPILGDKKYSDSKNMQIADESIGRIHLHMSKITLK